GQALVVAFIGNVLRVLQLSTGRILASARLENYGTINIAPDGKSLLVAGSETFNSSIDHRSLPDLGLIRRLRLTGETSIVKPAIFDPTGKSAIIGNFDGSLRLWDVNRDGVVREFRGHTDPISDIRFISSGQKIVSSSNDGFRVWDRTTGELLITFIMSIEEEWLAITPEGFFDSSPNASKGL